MKDKLYLKKKDIEEKLNTLKETSWIFTNREPYYRAYKEMSLLPVRGDDLSLLGTYIFNKNPETGKPNDESFFVEKTKYIIKSNEPEDFIVGPIPQDETSWIISKDKGIIYEDII